MTTKDTPETVVSDTSLILPPCAGVIVIAGTEYPVPAFCFGKTLQMLRLLSEFVDKTDLASLFRSVPKDAQPFLVSILEKLPDLLGSGRMPFLRVLGLALMPNALLKRIDLEGGDFERELKSYVEIVYDVDTDKATEILSLAIDGMGIDSLRKNFPKLLRKIGGV